MKKCLISVQLGFVLALVSGCVVVPGHHRTMVHHPAPPPIHHHRPAVVVDVPRPRIVHPAPVVRVEAPRPILPPPVVIVEAPKPDRPVPPVVVVQPPKHQPTPPRAIVVKAREPQPAAVHVTINPREREIIKEYVGYKKSNGHGVAKGKPNKGLPKGIAKKVERGHELPPGWQKKCVRGQIMPAEVFRHCEPLPHDVVVKLPPPPAGTIIVTLEGKAVRLMQATLEILDVFDVL